MNVKANTKQDAIEIIFDDYFLVRDYESVDRIVKALAKIRSEEELKSI